MAKIAIIIDTSISMRDSRLHQIAWTQQMPDLGDHLKDYPMGALAIKIAKSIASKAQAMDSITCDIFAFGDGVPPKKYKSFDEIPAPSGGTPMTDCLEFLVDQGYRMIYAISDGVANRPATAPWPDGVATIFVIPTIEDAGSALESMVHSDPHTAATIIAAFFL
jgi:hypothetical protein